MRKARFTEGEIVAMLREADRELVLAVAKRNRISEQTIFSWRKRRPAAEAARPRMRGRSRFASSMTTFILWTEENSPPQEAGGPGSVIAMLVGRTKGSEGHGEPLIGSSSTSQLMKSMVRISVWVSASLAAGFAFLFNTGWTCPRFFLLQHSLQ